MQVLVTRPQGKGQSLVDKLHSLPAEAFHQPVLTIEPGPDLPEISAQLTDVDADILIFVSTFAVEYFISEIKTPLLLEKAQVQLMAVGQSTGQKLRTWTKKPVITPEVETSEGLLALAELGQVEQQKVIICRGVGGRELLKEQLCKRGARVEYWQLYQRTEIKNQGEIWFEQWQARKVDCIVVTSVAILNAIFTQLPDKALPWLRSRKWIAASSRIVDDAIKLGIASDRITDAHGASDEAIMAQVKQLIEN